MKSFKNIYEAVQSVEIEGVRVIPKSTVNITVVDYDEIERYEDSKYRPKGTPKQYEIDRFQDEFDIDIEYKKKGEYPFSYNYKTKRAEKITWVERDIDAAYLMGTFKMKGIPSGFVYLYFWNDNTAFLVHQADVGKIKGMNFQRVDKISDKAE